MYAGTTTRGGTDLVLSDQGTYFRAPVGHASTHSLQRLHLVAFFVALFRDIISQGQACVQMPQPTHLSTFTTLALSGAITSMAS